MKIMSTKERRTGLLQAFSAGAFLCFAAGLLLWPGQVTSAVKNSISYCLAVLTPSLFPFMALTAFAVDSGAGDALGRGLGWLTRRLFRLPAACTAGILLGFIGGYPAGAKAASLLLERGSITEREAGRMVLFCVNPGLAFVVTFLGIGVFGDRHTGWLLFWSVTLSGVLLGILSDFSTGAPVDQVRSSHFPQPGMVIRSAVDASRSVLVMCACIVLFSGFTGLLQGSGIFQMVCRQLSSLRFFTPMEWATVLSFLLEVTGGVGTAAEFHVGPAFFAFGLGFGGLCVHLQVFSCFRELPVSSRKFLLFRFLHGGLAATLCTLLGKVFPGQATTAMAIGGQEIAWFSDTFSGGLSLLLMCSAFLLIAGRGSGIEK